MDHLSDREMMYAVGFLTAALRDYTSSTISSDEFDIIFDEATGTLQVEDKDAA